jgi:hypothetical protein
MSRIAELERRCDDRAMYRLFAKAAPESRRRRSPIATAPLLALLALSLSAAWPGRAAANQLDEVDAINSAWSTLVGWNAYQPIFNGLKYTRKPWQETIVSEHGARFFTPASVRDSFLFIIDPPPEGVAGRTVSRDQARAFCKANIGAGPAYDSAHRRLAGLCALADCRLVGREQWAGLARSAGFGARPRAYDGRDRDREEAQDAAFLLRVAALCGEAGAARNFAAALTGFSRFIARLREACGRRLCSDSEGGENELIRRSLAVNMNLLFAATESEQVPAELMEAAASGWLSNRAVAPPSDEWKDKEVEQNCARAQVAASDCRRDFPHSFHLEANYLQVMARLFVSAGPGADPCVAVAFMRPRFVPEIGYRFPGPAPAGTKLRFAPRCP